MFTNAHAHNVVTLPSHANILTGLYPYQHGVRDNTRLPPAGDVPTLATVLRGAGYATGAFVGAYPLDSRVRPRPRLPGLRRPHHPRLGRRGVRARRAARRRGRGPALDWWNGAARASRASSGSTSTIRTRPTRRPSRSPRATPRNPYLGEVAATDSFLAPLLGPCSTARSRRARGRDRRSRRGAGGARRADPRPLRLRGDAQGAAGRSGGRACSPARTAAPARHVDIFPTVLQAAGVQAAKGSRPGRSLLAPAGSSETVSYFEALSTNLNRGWAPLRGVLRGGRKFIALPLPELYDLPKDPGRSEPDRRGPARGARPDRGAAAGVGLAAAAGDAPGAEDEARLRSLGYLCELARRPARATARRTIPRTWSSSTEDPADHRAATGAKQARRGGRAWRARW